MRVTTQCNRDSDCGGSTCTGSSPSATIQGSNRSLCESHSELQVYLSPCFLFFAAEMAVSASSHRPLAASRPVDNLSGCVNMSASLTDVMLQDGGAVKCYYKETFPLNATGDYAVR